MIYLGIDPGLTGAIAVIQTRGESFPLVHFHDAPTVPQMVGKKIRQRYDIKALDEILRQYSGDSVYAVIEDLHAMPKNGGSSNFASGYGYGMYRALLVAFGIPHDTVPPQRWKKLIGIAHAESDADKKGLDRVKACALFPQASDQMKMVKHHGRADALLIAEYGRRTRGNA